MNKRVRQKALAAVLAVVALMGAAAVPAAAEAGEGPAYYVDAVNGNDANDGASPGSAWKTLEKVSATTFAPGDRILLKRGCAFNGVLWPKGSGTEGNPIVIDAYGEGSRPIIDGQGVCYDKDSDPSNYVDAAVYFCDQEYITVRNLEVTNDAEALADRMGIHFDAKAKTDGKAGRYVNYRGLTVENCYVHDIASDHTNGEHARMAAIITWSRNWYASFSDVLIQNNEIANADSCGIYMSGHSPAGAGTGNRILNNYLHDIGGNGIITIECVAPLVEYNVVSNSHYLSTQHCVAFWPFGCEDATFRFNEAYGTKTAIDGQGLDCDYQCTGTLFEYNYAHDNDGGFILICCEPTTWDGKFAYNDNIVVRYNIGQNNGGGNGAQIQLTGQIKNTTVYNNTLYVPWGYNSDIVSTYSKDNVCYPDNTRFYNNLIYSYSGGAYTFLEATNTVWENNAFFGKHHSTEPDDPYKLTDDPRVVNPGGADVGLDSCGAYALYNDSPLIGAGKSVDVSSSGFTNCGEDFFGNPVISTQAPNIGAYNGAGVADSSRPHYWENRYKTLYSWEENDIIDDPSKYESTQKRIWWLSFGNTTAWLSTCHITGQADALTPGVGSAKALAVVADRVSTDAGNAKIELYVEKGWLEDGVGIRMWANAGDRRQSVDFNFIGPDGMNLKVTKTIPAGGGWVEVEWSGQMYSEKIGDWENITVTPEMLQTMTMLQITFHSLPKNETVLVDEIQLKMSEEAVPPAPFENPYPEKEGILTGLDVEQNTVEAFKASFQMAEGVEMQISDDAGNPVTSGRVGTGMTVTLLTGAAQLARYQIVVYGDVTGNGTVDSADLLMLKRHILQTKTLDGLFLQAADADRNQGGRINSADLLAMKRGVLGIQRIEQNEKSVLS